MSKTSGQPFKKFLIPSYVLSDYRVIESNNDGYEILKNIVKNFFERQANPFEYSLDLLHSLKMLKKKNSNKIKAVLEVLEDWSKFNKIDEYLSSSLKIKAVQTVIALSNEAITKKISEIFRLKNEIDYVKYTIAQLLQDCKYKEAYYLMSALDLEREFSLQEFVFPAFLLDQEHIVKSYLEKCPDLKLTFVKTLDSVYQKPCALSDFARSLNIGKNNKNMSYLKPKWMKKRLPSYIEALNIDIRECPNVYFSRVQGAMYYLIHKRYTEESIEPAAFEELVADLVADHPMLQRELLIKLVCYNDSTAAFIVAKILNLDKYQWPDCLKSIPQPSDEFLSLYQTPQIKSSPDFLPLRLNQSDIHFVETSQQYFHAVNDISENYDVIGIDAEWKPNLGIASTKLSLLQVAVWDAIYLFDVMSLNNILKQSEWEYLLNKIFYNIEILKLGYGLENDLKELLKVIKCGVENYSKCLQVVELKTVFEKLNNNYPDVINEIESLDVSNSDEIDSKGLSQLCKVVLGKPLDKREQFSNWERRPLRESQIVYAALDAFCILMIYEKLYHILRNLNLSLDQLTSLAVVKKKEKCIINSKPKEPLEIKNFKVVTDCMLNGLGKYLRMFGADVVCLNDGDDPRCALEIAQNEMRIILSCGSRYEKLKGYLPQDMCFCVDNKVDLKRQVAEIQKHFNLQMDESTLFSRCTICNAHDYLKVRNEEMFSLWCKLVDEETKWGETGNSRKKINSSYKCDIVVSDGVRKENVLVQLATLSPKIFERVNEFLICIGCGKIYWEGSHLSRLKDSVSSVIEIKPSNENFYKILAKDSTSKSDSSKRETNSNPKVETSSESSLSRNVLHFDATDSSDDELDDIVYN